MMIHIFMTGRLYFCNVVNTPEHSSTNISKVRIFGKQKKENKI